MMSTSGDNEKNIIDAAAVLIAVGSVTSLLPPLAAILTIIWTTIRILETKTIQSLIKKCRRDKEPK